MDNNVWLRGRRPRGHRHRRRPRSGGHPAARSASRRLSAIVCTHGHNDHINAAPQVADAQGRPGAAAPGRPGAVADDLPGPAAGRRPRPTRRSSRSRPPRCGCCTPPATRRAACACTRPRCASVFSGDTLFHGGPGATGRSYSDHDTIISVHPGQADGPAPGDRRAHRARRGHHDRRRIRLALAVTPMASGPPGSPCGRGRARSPPRSCGPGRTARTRSSWTSRCTRSTWPAPGSTTPAGRRSSPACPRAGAMVIDQLTDGAAARREDGVLREAHDPPPAARRWTGARWRRCGTPSSSATRGELLASYARVRATPTLADLGIGSRRRSSDGSAAR